MITKNSMFKAEYIWLDGTKPTQAIRSKTRMLPIQTDSSSNHTAQLKDFPEWSFDGSSTGQADTKGSDCILKPAFICKDPTRTLNDYLVLCEVFSADNKVHPSNQRAFLRQLMEKGAKEADIYVGFEQEYTLFQDGRPLGWPEDGEPQAQGPFYCGVGTDKVCGREIVEAHMTACQEAGLSFYGINAEVMLGQWEFQIGYRGLKDESADPLTMADQIWMARYLLQLIGEPYGVRVCFDNKPVKGDWNGAGMHTNFSSKDLRDPSKGKKALEEALKKLEKTHQKHIDNYGHGLADRLTGAHETCSISEFKSGVSDRGCAIRIPPQTEKNGCGYFEDRRPGANADPYRVASCLVESICGSN